MPQPTWQVPFLTELDPEIAVKGSIDPLGLLPMWSRFGRELVGNLTSVSSSARGFTTLLTGFWFARRCVEAAGGEEAGIVGAFLRYEQLVGYSRTTLEGGDDDFSERVLGVQRVRKRLADGASVPIGTGRDAQIMSNQKAYGLWGLFSAAAESGGLLNRKRMRLTPSAEAHIAAFVLPRLEELMPGSVRLLVKRVGLDEPFDPRGRHLDLARALAKLHAPRFDAAEVSFYDQHLVRGGPAGLSGRQGDVWELLRDTNDAAGAPSWSRGFAMDQLDSMISLADARGEHETGRHLRRTQRFERLVGPAARLFVHLEDRDGQHLQTIVDDLRAVWGDGFAHIDLVALDAQMDVVEAVQGTHGADRFRAMARALRTGDWARLLTCVLDQNRDVMARRGGGAWIDVEGGILKVRYRQESVRLPAASEVPSIWDRSYFLDALKRVGQAVHRPIAGPSSPAHAAEVAA